MLCNVLTCYQELLHAVQCCYMLPRVITCCAVLLHVTCYQDLLHAVQCCYMLPRVITFCAVLLRVISSYYMMCSVVPCGQDLLYVVQYS